ncbi:hypothetical protein HDU67_007588 [Dinochytrium kinnereticum]|nr:hypothetical protein HDU67_007588 [Dinochytrium kinnereticum]
MRTPPSGTVVPKAVVAVANNSPLKLAHSIPGVEGTTRPPSQKRSGAETPPSLEASRFAAPDHQLRQQQQTVSKDLDAAQRTEGGKRDRGERGDDDDGEGNGELSTLKRPNVTSLTMPTSSIVSHKLPLTPEAVVAQLFTVDCSDSNRPITGDDASTGGEADRSATDLGGSMASLPLFNVTSRLDREQSEDVEMGDAFSHASNLATASSTRRSSCALRELGSISTAGGVTLPLPAAADTKEEKTTNDQRVEMWLQQHGSVTSALENAEGVGKQKSKQHHVGFREESRPSREEEAMDRFEQSLRSEHGVQNASRYSGFVEGPFDRYTAAMSKTQTVPTDLELQALVDCYGVMVDVYQPGTARPTSLHPTPQSLETSRIASFFKKFTQRDTPNDPVKLCLLGPNRYHRLVPVSRTEGEVVLKETSADQKAWSPKENATGWGSDQDEELREAIMLSLQEPTPTLTQQHAHPSNPTTTTTTPPPKPPLHPSTSTSSMASTSSPQSPTKPRVDRILKSAATKTPNGTNSGSGSSMDDEEFEALQAVLEMSLREAHAPPAQTPAPKLGKRSRRVSFAEGVKGNEEDAGRYDEEEALRLAIEASRIDMMERQETCEEVRVDEDGEVISPRRWKGKGKAE